MRLISLDQQRIYIETFGCQMNVADSERATTRLRASGYELVKSEDTADVVIFNTCSVREKAEQKVFHRIRDIRKQGDEKYPVIGIMGCVAQLMGPALFEIAPSLKMVIGTGATDRIPQLLNHVTNTNERIIDLGGREEKDVWDVSPAERHSKYIGFVPIVEGCNKFCTYCIVPYSRGRERSRPAIEVIFEGQNLLAKGYKEIQLIGQNVNSYRPISEIGLKGFSGATPFSKLLRAVSSTGLPRIKFTTSFPRDFHADIVRAIEENENLCNWIHLPVQSGNNRILRAMRRGYKVEDYIKSVETIKNARRGISLTSDIIVGFPGETEEEFEDTMKLVERCQFDGLYIFKYSERRGTPAAKLNDTVSSVEKARRFLALEKLQVSIQHKLYSSYVGSVVDVLVEGLSARSSEDLTGHTSCNKVVNFKGLSNLIGKIVSVRITEAKPHSLYGGLIEEK
jgi:tRNA-2-methylthio-N6-dimethylallyladenosine synthase